MKCLGRIVGQSAWKKAQECEKDLLKQSVMED